MEYTLIIKHDAYKDSYAKWKSMLHFCYSFIKST